MFWRNRRITRLALGLSLISLLIFGATIPAFAAGITGGVAVTGGSLGITATDNPTLLDSVTGLGVVLDGANKTATDTFDIDVNDSRGTGNGWHLQITSTQFKDATLNKTLSTSAATITGVTEACTQGTCTLPTNSTGAVTVPAGSTAPTAVTFYNADTDTGMGDITVTPTISVAIPANTYAASYSSTITISYVAGP